MQHAACQTEEVASKLATVQVDFGNRSFSKVLEGTAKAGKSLVPTTPAGLVVAAAAAPGPAVLVTATAVTPARAVEATAVPAVAALAVAKTAKATPARAGVAEKRLRSSPEEPNATTLGKTEEEVNVEPAECDDGFTSVQRRKNKAKIAPNTTKETVVAKKAKPSSKPAKDCRPRKKPDRQKPLIVRAQEESQYDEAALNRAYDSGCTQGRI